jgi:hypothetical protein
MITPTLFVACCARCRTISAMICSTDALIEDDKPEPVNLPLGYTRETYEAELARRARYANWGKTT